VAAPCAPIAPSWTYPSVPDSLFFSNNVSGYEYLASGHHLICQGANGRFFELDENEDIVWEYINPETANGVLTQGDNPNQNTVFRASHVSLSHPGIADQSLDSGPPLELNPNLDACEVNSVLNPANYVLDEWRLYPNPTSGWVTIECPHHQSLSAELQLYDACGGLVHSETFSTQTRIATGIWSPGMYFGILRSTGRTKNVQVATFKLLVQ
jgi:hypothetical protein